MSRRKDLARLDAALLDLRRFVRSPSAGRDGSTVPHGSDRVEVSTVLVVDVVTRHDGSSSSGCSVGSVAEELQVAHSTASRLVERAVRAGMVRRTRSTTDPRVTDLSVTAAGRRLQRDAVDFRTRRLRALLADWPAADVETFADLLERFARSAHPPTEETP
jgi:DNA-binding MarR family transcriptional regulator